MRRTRGQNNLNPPPPPDIVHGKRPKLLRSGVSAERRNILPENLNGVPPSREPLRQNVRPAKIASIWCTSEKRRRAAAIQDARALAMIPEIREASWSASSPLALWDPGQTVKPARNYSRQNVRGREGGTEGARRRLTNLADVINAALRTTGNFPGAIELDVRRQVVRKMNRRTVGQSIFQSKLVRSSINLPKIIDAGIAGRGRPGFDKSRNTDKYKKATEQPANGTKKKFS